MKAQQSQAASDIDLALQHYRAGRLQQAEAICKKMPHDPEALHLRGVIAHQLNRHEEALELIGAAIRAMPAQASFYYAIDPVYRALNRLDEAIVRYRELLALTPNDAAVHNNLGNALKDSGDLDGALDAYRRALALQPDLFEAHYNMGCTLKEQGKLDESLLCFQHAAALRPDFSPAHNNLGIAFADQGNLDQAIASYRQALARDPGFALAHCNLGNAFREQGKLDDAVASYRQALALKPDFPEAYNNLGITLQTQGKSEDAIACYRKALAYQPGYGSAQSNLASALQEQGKLDDAIECYRQALALKPDDPVAHCNLGDGFRAQGMLDEAVTCYLQALTLKLDYPAAHNNLGIVFAIRRNPEEAIACYQTALALKPDFVEAHNNMGNALRELKRPDEALHHYHAALALNPDFAEVHNNIGRMLHDQGKPDEAIVCYRKALANKANYPDAHDNLLLELQYSGTHTPEDVFTAHVQFADQFETQLQAHWSGHANSREPGRRLKIAYVSPDFHKHAVAYFIEPVLACHDKAQVEVTCYYSHAHYDEVTHRLKALADRWVPCKHLSDHQLAERIRADGIDILIDLAGHTGGNRLLTFARRPAPVQATYLGYPATTGLSAIDYRITDVHAEPPGMTEALNTEQLWRLPEIFCCYRAHDNSPEAIDHPPSQDNGYVTFGCFNNFSKLTDPVLALWARLLQQLPTARLMLEIHGIDHEAFRLQVEERLTGLGLPLERLVLVPRRPENQYVLYNRIDIALDPFPCNGGTTSLDTVWMGVPFVTLAGRHFTSRMGVTILTNAGLPDLIAQSEEEYLAIAAALAQDAPRLQQVRAGLRQRVQHSPLMDAPRFTAHLEHAYRDMWQTWCAQASKENPV